MLPPVLTERECTLFNFWLDNQVQNGMVYEGELLCRICTLPTTYRAQLYHYAYHLAKRDSVVISITDESCSLWISLRSPNLEYLKAQNIDKSVIHELIESFLD